MGKEKIKSISHTENIWWIRVSATSRSVEYINLVLKKFDPWEIGLQDCSCELDEKFSTEYKFWKNRGFDFFPDNECGYILFMEDKINILLRKENKLFNKLRNEFLKYFKIIKVKR